ncbi:hypothetical protein CDAR_592471 [Caerostris darwini]|uniref:Uncharacterized protein n=1 Tax=Caerostris darwini TaxID=1538125 RepID=A0AAV4TYL1_9ARAC|nr:hypothetical protein CDAR_592471 [Caerostris darwini]
MGRAKLPPDEARRRRLESTRRSRQKPEVKQKICEAEFKLRLVGETPGKNCKASGRAIKPESMRVHMRMYGSIFNHHLPLYVQVS